MLASEGSLLERADEVFALGVSTARHRKDVVHLDEGADRHRNRNQHPETTWNHADDVDDCGEDAKEEDRHLVAVGDGPAGLQRVTGLEVLVHNDDLRHAKAESDNCRYHQ